MKKIISILTGFAILSMFVFPAFAIETVQHQNVIYTCDDELTMDEIDYRIAHGISDVAEVAIPLKADALMEGNVEGTESKCLGSTTQLTEQCIEEGGNVSSRFVTTFAYEIVLEEDKAVATSNGHTPISGSFTLYISADWRESRIGSIAHVELKDVSAYYRANDAVVNMTNLVIRETSKGQMRSGSTSLGYKELNRTLVRQSNPTVDRVYGYKSAYGNKINAPTGYLIAWFESVMDYGYAGGEAAFTYARQAGSTTYTVDVRVYNDRVLSRALDFAE